MASSASYPTYTQLLNASLAFITTRTPIPRRCQTQLWFRKFLYLHWKVLPLSCAASVQTQFPFFENSEKFISCPFDVVENPRKCQVKHLVKYNALQLSSYHFQRQTSWYINFLVILRWDFWGGPCINGMACHSEFVLIVSALCSVCICAYRVMIVLMVCHF